MDSHYIETDFTIHDIQFLRTGYIFKIIFNNISIQIDVRAASTEMGTTAAP